jgi:GNAT superfamily N-acetyltransferase
MSWLGLRVVSLDDPVARGLEDQHRRESRVRYQGSAPARLTASEFASPTGCFVVAFDGEAGLACGGFRKLDVEVAELKCLYVRPAARQQGLGRRVLTFLELRARDSRYGALCLETGIMQPEALALYESAGYGPIDGFGEFSDDPRNHAFRKPLLGSGT